MMLTKQTSSHANFRIPRTNKGIGIKFIIKWPNTHTLKGKLSGFITIVLTPEIYILEVQEEKK